MALVQGAADPVLVSDRSLISRSRRGDREAFARLYDRYRRALYQICLRRLKDPSLAEDIVHETFLRALSHIGSFDTDRRMFPWLAAIAQNACVDVLRSRSKTNLLDDFEESDEEGMGLTLTNTDTTLEAVISSEERQRLGQALSLLPARQRRVLLLYALDNWSYSEIALAEQSSVASIKSIIFRARDNLRRICERAAMSVIPLPLLRLRLRAQKAAADIDPSWTNAIMRGMAAVQFLVAPAVGIVLALSVTAPSGMASAETRYARSAAAVSTNIATKSSTTSANGVHATTVTPQVTGLSPRLNASTPRPGTVAPNQSHLTIDVVGPDGSLIYRNETTIECEGAGHTFLPDDGPVTAAC